MTPPSILVGLALGALGWTLAEYLLHRFAMHALKGRGIMSREHLEHHVTSSWTFGYTHLLSWAGMLLVGFAGWMPLAHAAGASWPVAASVAVGWALGYFLYEFLHARSHLAPPATTYGRWMRRHHFHHHFGHPNANHGVTVQWWDRLFGTRLPGGGYPDAYGVKDSPDPLSQLIYPLKAPAGASHPAAAKHAPEP